MTGSAIRPLIRLWTSPGLPALNTCSFVPPLIIKGEHSGSLGAAACTRGWISRWILEVNQAIRQTEIWSERRLQELHLAGANKHLRAAGHAQLAKDIIDVSFDGSDSHRGLAKAGKGTDEREWTMQASIHAPEGAGARLGWPAAVDGVANKQADVAW